MGDTYKFTLMLFFSVVMTPLWLEMTILSDIDVLKFNLVVRGHYVAIELQGHGCMQVLHLYCCFLQD